MQADRAKLEMDSPPVFGKEITIGGYDFRRFQHGVGDSISKEQI
jgi:hypothetical protein